MSKKDSIQNYNVSYENLLEASNAFEGYVAGLSDNDLFLFLNDDKTLAEKLASFAENLSDAFAQSSNSVDADLDKFLKQIAPRLLDRTTGTSFLRDFLNGKSPGITDVPEKLGDYMHVVYHPINTLFDPGMYGDADKSAWENLTQASGGYVDTIPTYPLPDGAKGYFNMSDALTSQEVDVKLVQLTDSNGEDLWKDADKEFPKTAYDINNNIAPEMSLPKGVNTEIVPDRFSSPNLCAITMRHPKTGVLSKGTRHLPIFFNAIPPIEMSRCSPYINIKVLHMNFSNDRKFTTSQTFKFEKSDKDELTNSFDNINPVDIPPGNSTDANDDDVDYSFMDIFTTPQTFSNADVNKQSQGFVDAFNGSNNSNDPILEPIMPLMTLKSLNVSITGAGYGLMSSKRASMKLILHDRSRMADISPLISVKEFATTKIEIEYGWNHPDSSVNSENVIGRFLSSLKEKAIYGVEKSNFSFGDSGEVTIDVNLVATGYRDTERIHIGAGPVVPINAISGIIEKAAADLTKDKNEANVPDVRNVIKLTSRNARSQESVLSWELWLKIMEQLKQGRNGKDKTLLYLKLALDNGYWNDNYDSLTTAENILVHDLINSGIGNIENSRKSLIESVYGKLNAIMSYHKALDPFKTSTVYTGIPQVAVDDGETASLGYILTQFVGYPLASTCLYDEVQLVFYPLNHHAGGARVHTTASLPIPLDRLETLIKTGIKKNQSITVNSFIGKIDKEIIRDRNLKIYGFSELDRANDTSADGHEAKKADIATRCTELYQKDGLKALFPAAPKFVRPTLAVEFEVIPAIAPSTDTASSDAWQRFKGMYIDTRDNETGNGLQENKSILRLHIYDEEAVQEPGSFSILNSLISGATNELIQSEEGKDAISTEALKTMTYWGAKQYAKRSYPSIIYGAAGSTIQSISVSANTSGEIAHVQMIDSYGATLKGQVAGHVNEDEFGSIEMIPNTITIQLAGIPMIGRGASIFVDFNTNTSLDNIYTVLDIIHNISAGDFTTTIELVPSNMGAVRDFKKSVVKTIDAAIK